MKHNSILKLFFYSFIILIFFSSCKLSEIQFRGVEGYKLTNASAESVSMNINFSIDNPSAFNIKVKPSHLDLYLDGKLVGDLKIDKKVRIKKRTDGTYEMPVTAIFDKGLPISTLMKGRVTAKIDGKIKAKILLFSKKFEITETMPISLGSLF